MQTISLFCCLLINSDVLKFSGLLVRLPALAAIEFPNLTPIAAISMRCYLYKNDECSSIVSTLPLCFIFSIWENITELFFLANEKNIYRHYLSVNQHVIYSNMWGRGLVAFDLSTNK